MKREVYKNEVVFLCGSCGFGYREEALGKKCEQFCKKNKSCSTEITKHAVKK